jgi:hypothetical protein
MREHKMVGEVGFKPTTYAGYLIYSQAPTRFGITPEKSPAYL